MAYIIKIKTENGVTVLDHASGMIPEGTHEIIGHDAGQQADIGIRRSDGIGNFVISAQHIHDRKDHQVPLPGFFSSISGEVYLQGEGSGEVVTAEGHAPKHRMNKTD